MKILSVYLRGFKPLALRNINEITIDFTEQVTLVLGRNGCGKSSLLRESTPLPAVMEDYYENGEKRITLEHNGHHYELVTVLKKSAKHSFYKNGIALLEHGITSTQQALVESELNYTDLIHKLLIGKLTFTTMSVGMRRDILTMISPLDLNYAIELHNKIKVQIRDNQAIIKHLNSKRGEIEHKLKDLNQYKYIEEQKTKLENELSVVMPFALLKSLPSHQIQKNINESQHSLMSLHKQLHKEDGLSVPTRGINNVTDLTTYIGQCNGELNALQSRINDLYTELDGLVGVTQSLSNNHLSTTDIESYIAQCDAIINDFVAMQMPNVDGNLSLYSDQLITLYDSFISLDDMLSKTHYFTVNEIKDINHAYNKISTLQAHAINELDSIKEKGNHYKNNHSAIECHQCKTKLTLEGQSVELVINDLRNKATDLIKQIKSYKEQLDILTPQVEHIQLFNQVTNSLITLKNNITLPSLFWNEFTIESILQYPSLFSTHIVRWQKIIEQTKIKNKALADRETYKDALSAYQKCGGSVSIHIEKQNKLLDRLLLKQQIIKKDLVICQHVLKQYMHYTEMHDKHIQLSSYIDIQYKSLINAYIKEDAEEKRSKLYQTLSDINNIVTKKETLTNALNELNKEYHALCGNQECLLLLEKELSPKTGIVAEQMLAFITSYVEQLTDICSQVFTYDLTINPCNMDNGKLDYTFSVLVKDALVKDINILSSGQAEVVNLAFMLVLRQYLNLMDYPLYLDEIGIHFDSQHRNNLSLYIKQILQEGCCSQLFIIEHYTHVQNFLPNHDTIVLDATNITVPDNYNQHTTIKTGVD